MSRILLSAAALGLMATSCLAGDMPASNDWTGFYIGANANWNFISTDVKAPSQTINNVTYDSFNPGNQTGNGPGGGIQFGFDYQMENIVLGIQAMTSIAATDSSGNYGASERLTTELTTFGALTARLGYLIQPDILAYGKGGLAFASFKYTDKDSNQGYTGHSDDNRLQGWTVGGGVEWRFAPNWSAFAEYDYTALGQNTVELSYKNADWGNRYKFNYDQNVGSAVLGVNYRF